MKNRLAMCVLTLIAVTLPNRSLARDVAHGPCIVSDAVATAVFGEPMHGRPIGTSCAFVGNSGKSLVLLDVRTSSLAPGEAGSADNYFDAFDTGAFATREVRGVGDRALFGVPIPARNEPGALAVLISVERDTVVTVYAPSSERLRTEALALNVFHALP